MSIRSLGFEGMNVPGSLRYTDLSVSLESIDCDELARSQNKGETRWSINEITIFSQIIHGKQTAP
jgi:hypothetical protein